MIGFFEPFICWLAYVANFYWQIFIAIWIFLAILIIVANISFDNSTKSVQEYAVFNYDNYYGLNSYIEAVMQMRCLNYDTELMPIIDNVLLTLQMQAEFIRLAKKQYAELPAKEKANWLKQYLLILKEDQRQANISREFAFLSNVLIDPNLKKMLAGDSVESQKLVQAINHDLLKIVDFWKIEITKFKQDKCIQSKDEYFSKAHIADSNSKLKSRIHHYLLRYQASQKL